MSTTRRRAAVRRTASKVSIRTLQAVHEATHPGTLTRHRSVYEARGDDHVEVHGLGEVPVVDQLLLLSVLGQEEVEENRPDPGSEPMP